MCKSTPPGAPDAARLARFHQWMPFARKIAGRWWATNARRARHAALDFDDVQQLAFVGLFHGVARLDPAAPLREVFAYLARWCLGEILSGIRWWRPRVKAGPLTADVPDPDDAPARCDAAADLAAAIATLPPHQRDQLAAWMNGRFMADIAADRGATKQAVSIGIRRSVEKLRRILD